jgi:predicted small secreted protein
MKTPTHRTVIILIASAIFAILGTSCGTVHGFGRDVSRAGDNIEDASR